LLAEVGIGIQKTNAGIVIPASVILFRSRNAMQLLPIPDSILNSVVEPEPQ
jgi:hypothetical protein